MMQQEANAQNEGNLGLQHTSTFIERNSWMKNYLPQATAGNSAATQFNANGTMVLQRTDQSRSAIDLKVNNFTGEEMG